MEGFRGRRKRDRELASLIQQANVEDNRQSSARKELVISFQNGEVSFTVGEATKCYSGRCDYDERLIGSPDFWHQIIVNHEKKFNFQRDILPQLYDIVGDEFFAPIAFRASLTSDYFFVNGQGKALEKLFENGLQVVIGGRYVKLLVRFCVAAFRYGMLSPHNKLAMVVSSSVNAFRVSDLSHLSCHQQLSDVEFSLRNKGCFKALCDQIMGAQSTMLNVKTLNLSNNGISDLQSLSKLTSLTFFGLDLRFNRISSIEQFEFVKMLRVQEIFLEGNPVTDLPLFAEKLKAILPSLKRIDGVELQNKPNTHQKLIQCLNFDNRSERITTFNSSLVYRAASLTDFNKKEFNKLHNESWNKVVVVHNGRVDKKTILDEMCRQFFNLTHFYPCYYQRGTKKDFFYLRKNFPALRILVMQNLTMTVPQLGTTVNFELHLKCAEWIDGHIDWDSKLSHVVRKRTSDSKLSLDELASDSDLCDMFVPMSTVAGLYHVLDKAVVINEKIICASLEGNNISSIDSLMFLEHFAYLVSIDLRRNRIESLEGFPKLPKLAELFLDENPICSKYSDKPWRYVKDLQRAFPGIGYIDGRRIDKNTQTVPFQNFVIESSAYTLTESFLKLFFGLYDSSCRSSLNKFYESASLFTLSCELDDKTNSYEDNSRNILRRLELEESKVFHGWQHISEFFEYLPLTQHDFVTMYVDVPIGTDEIILINVNGHFKEMGQSLSDTDRVYGFTRTFVLKRRHRNEGNACFPYLISNDQLHVRQISSTELRRAFKEDVVSDDCIVNLCKDMHPLESSSETVSILQQLRKITKLKSSWCTRILEDVNWDIEIALKYFDDFRDRAIFINDDFELLSSQ